MKGRKIGDIINITFILRRIDNCEIIEISTNAGKIIYKVKTPYGRIIPYVGHVKDQEKWANIVED